MAASRSSSPWPTLVKLAGAMVAAGVLGAGVLFPFVGGVGLVAKHETGQFLSTQCNLQETPPPAKTEVYARDGKTLIATIFTQDRQPVPLSQVPKYLQQALVATEDRRFYKHHGVDLHGLIRSAVNTSSGDTQGGSTLTMQYVKQMRYYQAGNNLKKQQAAIAVNLNRKMEDARCALYIENVLHEPKATILDNYLNIAFFGENSYGIETAAQNYFDKRVSQLSVPESAMLVGLLRAPTQYDPFVNPQAARTRRNEVLQNLVTMGNLSQAQADKYMATPISLATTSPPTVREGCANASSAITDAGFFCDYAVNWLLDHKAVTDSQLLTGGLKIVTTLNPGLQNSMERNLAKALPATRTMASIMPVLDPRTGDVLAMATSKKYGSSGAGATTLPIFTTATAQGASTYKLFSLLTALSTGVPNNWQLEIPPTKFVWHSCPSDNGSVTNGDANEYFPPGTNETMADAIARSSNTFFTGMADQLLECDLQPIINMAQSLGMTSLAQPSPQPHMTIAQWVLQESRAKYLVLGDVPTSPLELAAAYATVANDGVYNAPSPILSITDRNGNSIRVPRSPGRQVLAPQVAREAETALQGDTHSIGTSGAQFASWYAAGRSIVAGKTGTAPGGRYGNQNGALWFVGLTPNLVASSLLVNIDHPTAPASDLPGVKDAGKNAYGSYATGLWLKALGPTLATKSWVWPQPGNVPGQAVPPIKGFTLAAARTALQQAGFKMAQLDAANGLVCASTVTPGNIAFYGPKIAPKGSTITVCPSSGTSQDLYVYVPPPPPPVTHSSTPPSSGHSSGSPSGGSSSAPGGGGSTHSTGPTPPGHGGGTGTTHHPGRGTAGG